MFFHFRLILISFGLHLIIFKDTSVWSLSLNPFEDCFVTEEVCPNPNITFWFYTRSTGNKSHQLKIEDTSTIKNAPFNKDKPIVFLIHGYTGDKDFSPNKQIRPELLSLDLNVISVDYGPLAKSPCYIQAIENLKVVGNCTAKLIEILLKEVQISLEAYHLIGFSLGAHVTGWTAHFFKQGKFPHITGLDPAAPLFWFHLNRRLSKKDAKFVDVIHTNALLAGVVLTIGHVDFYVNGGSYQPGCLEDEGLNLLDVPSCSHTRAPEYYAESVTKSAEDGFWGTKNSLLSPSDSPELQIMGYKVPKSAKGVYNVKTASSPPFALGKKEAEKRANGEGGKR